MARPIERDIQVAWNALSGVKENGGWQSIAVDDQGFFKIRAARRFPENEEALLIGFVGYTPLIPVSYQMEKVSGLRLSAILLWDVMVSGSGWSKMPLAPWIYL